MHGPSAGLALALGFFNQDTGRCLEVGGEVAATGVVKDNGEVLGVGGVKDKTEAAVAAGNDILLVANSNLESAREAAEGRIRVVGVGRVSEAVLVLADDWRVRECLNESQARERMSEQREDAAWRYKTAVLPAGKSRRRASTQ
jgi:predicted S18 family serine protease